MEIDSASDKPITIVSFKISGSELVPENVTQSLDIIPHHTHLRGSYLRINDERFLYKKGLWSIKSKLPFEEEFSAHLENLLSILEPKQEQILKLGENNSVDFYCSLYAQIGFQLPPHLLRRIANLGAALGVTVYPP